MVCDKEAAAARVTVQPVETHVLCSWSTRGAHLNNPSLALQQTVQIFVWEFTETSGIEFGLLELRPPAHVTCVKFTGSSRVYD